MAEDFPEYGRALFTKNLRICFFRDTVSSLSIGHCQSATVLLVLSCSRHFQPIDTVRDLEMSAIQLDRVSIDGHEKLALLNRARGRFPSC